ncbi:30S ribosomal protein S1 [Spirochaeta cellobiosiphila]|uniref:30S ribosomal protein S1 n=1 Tax=Spirochaeta cellobiosiphila TaxID=504483 RepID=UPI0004120589|nr:30S ribosomal protein S1 [Spirochaeta cellobiosiphila]
MTENDPKVDETFNQTELQEQYLKSLDTLEEGQMIKGTIVQVGSENVFIDVGYKSEGKISIDEFTTIPSVGEEVEVLLVKKEGTNGQIVVSKKKADLKYFWKNIKDAHKEKTPIDGKITKSIKGGFEVDLGLGLTAFLPVSKTDVVRVENPEEYIGLESKFTIERYSQDKRTSIVVTRRDWLEKEIEERKERFFTEVQEGDEVEGTVKSFTSFGAFIDLGGFDGLLHINDMSWGHVSRPKDYVRKNQKVKLKVIKLDSEDKKINLSLKHFTEDPWSNISRKYSTDDVVTGTVTKLTDFGAFIELEEGVEGLAHVSELSWVKRIKHPKELLKIGDKIDAKILGIDSESQRISLGVKQVLPNPWDDIEANYPAGKKLSLVVKKITNAGAFLEVEEGIDGFLPVEDLSWTKRYKNAGAVLKVGESFDVVVTEVSADDRRIRLGIKQLSDDPWQSLAANYPKGSEIEGVVTSKTDFGAFVKVSDGIEGLINKNQLADPKEVSVEEALSGISEGDSIKAIVTEISPGRQRLSLSIRELKRKQERAEISKYIHEDEEEPKTTMAAFLNKDND